MNKLATKKGRALLKFTGNVIGGAAFILLAFAFVALLADGGFVMGSNRDSSEGRDAGNSRFQEAGYWRLL